MNKVSRSIFVGAAFAVALAGCDRRDAPDIASSPLQPVTSATLTSQLPKGDPSLPDAAGVAAAQDASEKTAAMRDVNAMQHKADPQEKMTKAEESKAMPLPGQANDHSTTALDKGKGG